MWVSERLIIRLASEASQKQHWLIWSDNEKEIIASGDIDNAEQLNTLTRKATSRQVICLLPGVDVCLREVPIAGAFNRQMQQALPYLIEEDLACDVEKAHITVITKGTDLVHVAICDKQRMHNWLDWLADAQISCQQFIPEGLALPVPTDQVWQAVQLDEHWIIRESSDLAWSCEVSMLDAMMASKVDTQSTQDIESYSPFLEGLSGDWRNAMPTLPMQLLTAGAIVCKANLLTGEFKVNKKANKHLLKWRLPAIFAILFFTFSCVNLYMQSRQIEAQTVLVKEQVESVYQLAFPNQSKLRYVRIKNRIKNMLAASGGDSDSSTFLVILDELAPLLKNNKQLRPSSLKYDANKKEMRILAVGNSFQAFEKFSNDLPNHYSLQQGALNSSDNQVSGLLTIRIK